MEVAGVAITPSAYSGSTEAVRNLEVIAIIERKLL